MQCRYRAGALLVMSGILMGLAAAPGLAAPEDVQRVALLELYTSEGCNSCPPVDRWVSGLPRALVP